MNDFSPEQLQEWINLLWAIGWRGLIVFAVIFYKDLVIHFGITAIDVVASWIKRK